MKPDRPAHKLNLSLRVVFYRQEGLWIAHCLEMDVMGHGRLKKQAFDMMERAVFAQVIESVRRGNLSNIFQAADPHIFQMFFAGEHVAVGGISISIRGDIPADSPVTVERIDTHEYRQAALAG